MGCFGYPLNCVSSKSCDMLVKYVAEADGHMFTLMSQDAGMNSYIALGFSKDDVMVGTSIHLLFIQ